VGAFYTALVALVKTIVDPGWRDPSASPDWMTLQPMFRKLGHDMADVPECRSMLLMALAFHGAATVLLLAAVWDAGRVAGYR
jgi:hypothetical protein